MLSYLKIEGSLLRRVLQARQSCWGASWWSSLLKHHRWSHWWWQLLVIMMMIILIDNVPRSIFAVNREREWEDLWKKLEAKLIEKRCKRLSCAGLTTKRQQKKCARRSKNSSSMMKKRSECEENLKRYRKDRKWGSKISDYWTGLQKSYFHRWKAHLVLQPKPI